jgi:hypothetical protein
MRVWILRSVHDHIKKGRGGARSYCPGRFARPKHVPNLHYDRKPWGCKAVGVTSHKKKGPGDFFFLRTPSSKLLWGAAKLRSMPLLKCIPSPRAWRAQGQVTPKSRLDLRLRHSFCFSRHGMIKYGGCDWLCHRTKGGNLRCRSRWTPISGPEIYFVCAEIAPGVSDR